MTIDDPALARRFADHRSVAEVSRRIAVVVLGSLCALATIVGFVPPEVLLLIVLVAAPVAVAAYVLLHTGRRHLG